MNGQLSAQGAGPNDEQSITPAQKTFAHAVAIDFYEDFACLGGACPQSCCRGWHISIDPKTYQNMMDTKGVKGLRLQLSTKLLDRRLPVMRKVFLHCVFHTKERLCAFQKNGEMQYMPKICRIYPRRSVFYGDITEVMFELSCCEAARLFLLHRTRLCFHPLSEAEEKKAEISWVLENEEPGFRQFLRRDREKLLDRLWEEDTPLFQAMADIYAYVWELQNLILSERIPEAEALQKEPLPRTSPAKIRVPFFPVKLLNELIYQFLSDDVLFVRNRPLSRMIRAYEKHFGKRYEAEADSFFRRHLKEMEETQPLMKDKYRAYLSYCLQELYCEAYEDYYLIGEIFLAFIYTEFLMLFDTAVYLEKGALPEDVQAENLAALERGIRHSIQAKEEFLRKIRADFL